MDVWRTKKFGRGFGRRNLFQMRAFYQAYPKIVQTVSVQLLLFTYKSFFYKKIDEYGKTYK